jgi:hypothetical protein
LGIVRENSSARTEFSHNSLYKFNFLMELLTI